MITKNLAVFPLSGMPHSLLWSQSCLEVPTEFSKTVCWQRENEFSLFLLFGSFGV